MSLSPLPRVLPTTLHVICDHLTTCRHLNLSRDGAELAVLNESGLMVLHTLSSGQLSFQTEGVSSLAFNDDHDQARLNETSHVLLSGA